jgi:hypothetical protein
MLRQLCRQLLRHLTTASAVVLVMLAAAPAGAIVIDFNAPGYSNAPLPNQNDPALGGWVSTTDVGFINVENTGTNGRLVIQPNPTAPFHNAQLLLPTPIAPDSNNRIIASFDLINSPEGADSGNIWKMMFKDAAGLDLARIQGHKNQAFGRLPQAGGMVTPPMLVGGANPDTRTMFIEINTSGDGGIASYYQDSIGQANLLGFFAYTSLDDQIALIQIETFNRGDLADNRARIDNITIIGAPERHTWNIDANGNWTEVNNWAILVPNAAGVEAAFAGAITAPRTVTVNAPVTVGSLFFDSASAYTIAGSNPLTLDSTGGNAQVHVASGNHSISAPITLADDAVFTVTPAANSLTLTGTLNAATRNVNKSGAGTLTVPNIRAAGLSINAGTLAVAAGGGNAGVSVVNSLTIAGDAAPTAKLDLANNAAIVDYTGTIAADSPAATVRQQILAGRGGPGLGKTWNGQGITSNAAAAAEAETRSVGYAENASLPLGAYTSFRGQAVDSTSLLIAFTRTGDANLDGVVNDDDVTIVGAVYAPGVPGASWASGDFDYNGFVDDDDVTLLGALYDPSAAPAAAPVVVSAVPEPSSFVLLAIMAAAVCLSRRWRRAG